MISNWSCGIFIPSQRHARNKNVIRRTRPTMARRRISSFSSTVNRHVEIQSTDASTDVSSFSGSGQVVGTSAILEAHLNVSRHAGSAHLVTFEQLPAWHQDNPLVRTGYRPCNCTIHACIASCAHIHNESVNIYSHLIPASFALLLQLPLWCETPSNLALDVITSLPPALRTSLAFETPLDKLTVSFFLAAVAICFFISAGYHTFMCHSRAVADLWLRLDFAGISLLVLASFVSGIRGAFRRTPALQWTYWTMIAILTVLSTSLTLHPRLQGPRWRSLRLSAFVGTGLSGFAPIAHGIARFGYAEFDRQSGMRYYLVEGVIFSAAAVCYGVSSDCFCRSVAYSPPLASSGTHPRGLRTRTLRYLVLQPSDLPHPRRPRHYHTRSRRAQRSVDLSASLRVRRENFPRDSNSHPQPVTAFGLLLGI